MSAFLRAALEYERLGYSVIQLEVMGKRPMRPWAQYQKERATPEQITEWWTEFPNANIGIICGKISGLVVVDVDPRNGGDAAEVGLKVPTHRIAKTGGGGVHYYTRYADGVASKPSITPGVDIKSDGGYVAAPPSIHPSGDPYVWVEEGDLCDVPDWCSNSAATPPPAAPPTDNEPWIAEALLNPDRVPCGEQESTLTRLAWYLSGKLPEDIARSLLQAWAAKLINYNMGDPWHPYHVNERVDRAYAKRAKENQLIIENDITRSLPKERGARLEAIKSKIITSEEFAARPREKVDWILEGLVGPSCITEVVGQPKVGKSTLICDMMRAMLEGKTYLERKAKAIKVLYLTEQMGISLESTLKRAGIYGNPNLKILTAGELMGYGWEETVTATTDYAVDQGCDLIVVDTLSKLARFAGDDENSSGKVMEALQHFEYAQQKGLAIAVIRHARKSGGGIGEAGRGSNAMTGVADICLNLKREKEGDEVRKLEFSSRLDSELPTLHLKFCEGRYLSANTYDVEMTANEKTVIANLPPDWRTPVEISERCELPERSVRDSLKRLMKRERGSSPLGMIEMRKNGKATQFRRATDAIIILEDEDDDA